MSDLVLVHGLGLSSSIWSTCDFVGRSVIAPDLPGFGAGERRKSYSIVDQLDMLVATIGEDRWAKSHVVLHSIASVLVVEMKVSQRLPATLSLVEGNLVAEDAQWSSEIAGFDDDDYETWLGSFRKQAPLVLRMKLTGQHSPEHLKHWSSGFAQADALALRSIAAIGSNLTLNGTVRDALSALSCPRQYIRGAHSTPWYAGSNVLDDLGVTLHTIADAGHYPMLDAPEKFVQIVTDFINEK